MKKAMVILNPSSGMEKASLIESHLRKKLEQEFSYIEVLQTQKEKDATDYAKRAVAGEFHSVFAVGGDGTVNEVISGLVQGKHRPILGIIPTGTYNCVARVLKIPLNIKMAIDELDFDHVKKMDVGKVNHQFFANNICVGELPRAINTVSKEAKSMFGMLAYGATVVRSAASNKRFDIRVQTQEGSSYEGEFSHMIVAVSDFLGIANLTNCAVKINDGMATLMLIGDENFFEKLSLIPNLMEGKVEKNQHVIAQMTKGIKVEIEQADELDVTIDGDAGLKPPFTIEVLKQAVDVYIGKKEKA